MEKDNSQKLACNSYVSTLLLAMNLTVETENSQAMKYIPSPQEQDGNYPPPAQPSYPPSAQPGYPPAGHPPPHQAGYPPPQAGYPPGPQAGYPPPQAGYPPSQAGYPPPQAGYPPGPQAGYPPPQSGYPPGPQAGYPPPKAGYNYDKQFDAPPPYYGGGPAPPPQQPPTSPSAVQSQQSTTNVVVVQQQPTAVITGVVHPVGDHYMTLSIVLTVLCCLCGSWCSLFCTIPAIVVAQSARDADSRGDSQAANTKGRTALILDIFGIVWWVILVAIYLGLILGPSLSVRTTSSYYYNGYYY